MNSPKSSSVLQVKTLRTLMQKARALLRVANADVTRASLQVALLYLFAEHVKAQSAHLHAPASEQEAEELLTEDEGIEPTADQSEEELDPEQAAAQLRALIDEELAVTAQARGIDPELQLAMEQEAQSAQSQSSSSSNQQANAGSEGAAKGFEWTDLKIGETGFSPFVVMGGGFLFNSLLAGGGPAAVVAKAVLYANGIVADGYISGAIVKLLDADRKVIASTTTDAFGRYTFDEALLKQASKVVASGGVDTSTGLKFEIELSAPSGATVINPLTTLVQSFIEANPGMSAAKAMQAVRTALGIPDSQDLLTLDPIAAAMSGTAEQKSLALALQIKAAQVANLLITASSAMNALPSGPSIQDAMREVLVGLTKQIANVASGAQKPFALNDVSIISSVTRLKGDAVLLIAEGNTFSADSLDGIYEFQKLVQDDLSNILSLGGTMSAEALQSLTALLKFVSQGNKVVDFKLAPFSDTSLNGSALLTHVADPSVRIDLKPLANTVKVGDTIQLTQEGREPTTVIVTPEDVARGYVDIKLPTFTQDGSATITVTVTDSQTQKPVASGVAAITYDSTVSTIGAKIAPHTDPVGGAGKPNVMITVTGLEAGAVWQYSLDNGKTWSAQISGPSTPVAAPQGAFVLTLRQIDRAGNESAPSQIKFEYSAGNFAPALTGAKAVLVDGVEDRSTIIKASDLLQGYSDAENQKLSIVNLTAKGDAGLVIQVVANNDGTYTLTAPANYNGAVVLSYGVSDGVAVTAATLQLNITAVNDVPVATAATAAVTEDASVSGSVSATDADTDETASLTYALTAAAPEGLTFNADGSYSFDASSYDGLAEGATRVITIGYIATDIHNAASTAANLVITITGTNDVPVATAATAAVTEDASVSGSVSATDADTDETASLTYALTAAAPEGLTFNADGSYSFVASSYDGLAEGATRVITIGYIATDIQNAASTAANLVITITGTNDVPVATAATAAVTEDASVSGSVSATDADTDETASLTYALTAAAPEGLTFNADGSYSFDASSYDGLAEGATRVITIGYIATDIQNAASTAANLVITITGTNDVPTITSNVQAGTVKEDETL
ncbi:Ig-like domain-containing protein, partial [Limnohabitans sp. DM1]|uniref:tandem-95 repeat protein n=1 Tax=Limnohabitans sp. DM1 TaxID=1597955 RepID=UPI001E33EAE2